MAQLPSAARIDQYVAAAGQTVFTYTYLIPTDVEIKVQKGDAILILATNYTVQDAGSHTGGTITLVVGALVGEIITLTGNTLIQRITEFQNNGDFLASAINDEYDVLDDIASEILTETQGGFRLVAPSPTINTLIPAPVAGRCLKWNETGTEMIVSDYDPDLAQGNAEASATAAAISAAAALVSENNAAGSAVDASGFADDAEQSAIDAAASAASIDLTAVGVDIKPDLDITRDLGSLTHRFAEGHIETVEADTVNTVDLDVSNDGQVDGNLNIDGALTVNGSPISAQPQMMIVQDSKAYNVQGGTFTSGAWRQRDLNTVEYNDITGASLALDQVTLPAGEYSATASVPAYDVSGHIAVIVTSSGDALGPKNSGNTMAGGGTSWLQLTSRFTLTEETDIEVWHQCVGTHNTNGFGIYIGISGQPSIYTTLTITKY